jgi:hypothetical protein
MLWRFTGGPWECGLQPTWSSNWATEWFNILYSVAFKFMPLCSTWIILWRSGLTAERYWLALRNIPLSLRCPESLPDPVSEPSISTSRLEWRCVCTKLHGVIPETRIGSRPRLFEVNDFLPYLLTELNPSWEANCAATQEPPRVLRNPKVHHRVHKSPPLVPILSQFDPVHNILSYLSKIHFNIVHPPTSWSS